MAGMEFIVRQMGTSDRPIWAEMRTALWPDETPLTHAKMVDELLADGDSLSLIAEATDGIAVGFAEIAVRKYANGCDTRPVAFLEGVLGQTAIQAARYWSTANSTRGNVASSTRVSRTWIRYVDRRLYVASGSLGMGIF